jgi:hypothetical protein
MLTRIILINSLSSRRRRLLHKADCHQYKSLEAQEKVKLNTGAPAG